MFPHINTASAFECLLLVWALDETPVKQRKKKRENQSYCTSTIENDQQPPQGRGGDYIPLFKNDFKSRNIVFIRQDANHLSAVITIGLTGIQNVF